MILLRAIVIAHYRLHALVKAHYYHCKDEHHAVDHPVGRYRHIAAIATELIVDDNHHKATREIGQKRRHTYR